LFLALCAALAASAKPAGQLPAYQPRQKLEAVIRSWGSEDMEGVMKLWEKGFLEHHAKVQFVDTLKGVETAQAGLYTSIADLALMSREVLPLEWYPLFRRKHHFPYGIKVATGSYDVPHKTFALAVMVHKDNPISKLTLKQLDGIFGEERVAAWDKTIQWHPELARGADENIRTWGQLGLTGEWADKTIRPYGYPTTPWVALSSAPGAAFFFQEQALGGGDKWNPALREYPEGAEITAALSQDRYGIGYTGVCHKTPQLKTVALAGTTGGPYVQLSRETVASR
jgi:phosphate transport system substrate-binding protein